MKMNAASFAASNLLRDVSPMLFPQAQAHIMHNEETRKFVQAVKRLITFAQRTYPSAPSMSFEFNANLEDKARGILFV